MTGPRLLAWIALSVASMIAWIAITSDGGLVETANTVIRWTARTSLVAFSLAYVARPAVQLYRNPFTKHLLAERKWIGLGYAASHAGHLAGIVVVASQDVGAFIAAQSIATLTGTFTFLLLFAMAFTSIEAVKRKLPARAWKLLHRTGMHFSWIAFTGTYGLAVANDPVYAVPTALLLAIATLRVAAWIRVRRRHRESGDSGGYARTS
jgi:DMSO/TMAO reductase YedYZ heme-binding membrane subunit